MVELRNRWEAEESGDWLILEPRSNGVDVERLDRLAPQESAGPGRFRRIIHRPDGPRSQRSLCGAPGRRRHRSRADLSTAERCSECFPEEAVADGGTPAGRARPAGVVFPDHVRTGPDGVMFSMPAAAVVGLGLFGLGALAVAAVSGGGR